MRKKKLRNLLLRSGPQKNREKLEFITAIWTNKWEIKEFITAIWTNKWEIKEFITAIWTNKWEIKEFITAIWTNKWEIKEFITAMEYLREKLTWRIFSILLEFFLRKINYFMTR